MNTAINLEASRDLNKRGRNADTFTFSPLHIGSRATGYVTSQAIEGVVGDLSLATAMATSGAAASANMGGATIKILTFSLSLLNIRLGYWLANPSRLSWFSSWIRRRISGIGTWFFLLETLGQLSEKKLNVYLTDGGHIENLGIYELLQRRCKVIVAVDAEADPEMTFPSLVNLQVLARIDLGIRIDLPWDAIRTGSLAVTDKAVWGPRGAPGTPGPHAAIGKILYGENDTGVLIYIKSSLSGDESDPDPRLQATQRVLPTRDDGRPVLQRAAIRGIPRARLPRGAPAIRGRGRVRHVSNQDAGLGATDRGRAPAPERATRHGASGRGALLSPPAPRLATRPTRA